MTIDYQLDLADLRNFTRERQDLASANAASQYYWYGAVPAICVGIAVTINSIGLALLFTFVFVTSGWLVAWYSRRCYEMAAYSEDNNSIYLLPHQVTVSETGILVSSPALSTCFQWPFIRAVARQGDYIWFELTPLMRYHVPVRAFSDPRQLETFVATARSYLKSAEPDSTGAS